jgi:hypothetical protein
MDDRGRCGCGGERDGFTYNLTIMRRAGVPTCDIEEHRREEGGSNDNASE